MPEIAPEVPAKDSGPKVYTPTSCEEDYPPAEWRNSLLAIDDEGGFVLGIVAHGVGLPSDTPQPDFPRDEKRELALEYAAAGSYLDLDVRQESRSASVLREDTYAPPPIPSKPMQLCSAHNTTVNASECCSINEEIAFDGRVKVGVAHVETHRPELLRDRDVLIRADHLKETSGSTIGGPIVRLWRNARGQKKGKTKQENSTKLENKESSGCSSLEHNLPSKACDAKKAAPVEFQTAEEETLQNRSHNNISQTYSKGSIMSHHLPGQSVLIDFLADSRITARITDSVYPNQDKMTAVSDNTLPQARSATPANTAIYDSYGTFSYRPVLPEQLLSFFGLAKKKHQGSSFEIQQAPAPDTNTSYAGLFLVRFAEALSPSNLIKAGVNSAMTVWSEMSIAATSITSWFGNPGTLSLAASNSTRDTDAASKIDEWQWIVPTYDPKSLDGTPRPIYRRRKMVPSLQGHFNARPDLDVADISSISRCSIVHCDQWGIARRAFTKA